MTKKIEGVIPSEELALASDESRDPLLSQVS
jgi:hypothetical protein